MPFTGWLLISGARDNRIYCSRCPGVFLTKSDTASHQGGGIHHRVEWTGPLDFAQEVGLPETSRCLLPNWLATSLSESIHLENSRVSASLFFSTKSYEVKGLKKAEGLEKSHHQYRILLNSRNIDFSDLTDKISRVVLLFQANRMISLRFILHRQRKNLSHILSRKLN